MATAPRPWLYNTFFKKNYMMLGVVFAGAFGFEMWYNSVMDKIWETNNRGRLWKDIRHKYVTANDDGDDDE
ncbi:ubiquinol-cytochrome C reductase [Apodospora peruviana]|uniref:Complex III subunit 9 n=1 Tax=Apodospora peruviana TaxID=516989 RepID=A0AAE0IQN0_9PEZI|nr:ubiquinol-cytochrome C reductase [Apodospora peruviana]